MNKNQTILLASSSIIFSLLAVPFLYRVYDEDFDSSEWRTYVRILIPFVGLLAGVFHLLSMRFGQLFMVSRVLYGVATAGSFYLLLFGVAYAAAYTCTELDSICMDPSVDGCFAATIFEIYETVLFKSAFFLLIVSGVSFTQTLGVSNNTAVTVGSPRKPRRESRRNSSLNNSRSNLVKSPERKPTFNSVGAARGGRRGRGRGSL